MNRSCINDALEAMDSAVSYILENVAPGTPGKIQAVTELRHQARLMVIEYAHRSRPITSVLPNSRTADA